MEAEELEVQTREGAADDALTLRAEMWFSIIKSKREIFQEGERERKRERKRGETSSNKLNK